MLRSDVELDELPGQRIVLESEVHVLLKTTTGESSNRQAR